MLGKEKELKNILYVPLSNNQLKEFNALRLRAVGGSWTRSQYDH